MRRSWALGVIGLAALALVVLSGCGEGQPEDRVFFIEPQNGVQVKSPFTVKMGAEGLIVEPAREDVEYIEGYGHHHIIVDSEIIRLHEPIPKSVQHLHFGKGQTEAVLDLEPGEHTLRLLFAKGDHVPWNPVISDTIKVTVLG